MVYPGSSIDRGPDATNCTSGRCTYASRGFLRQRVSLQTGGCERESFCFDDALIIFPFIFPFYLEPHRYPLFTLFLTFS